MVKQISQAGGEGRASTMELIRSVTDRSYAPVRGSQARC
jgi:hypothetical protein